MSIPRKTLTEDLSYLFPDTEQIKVLLVEDDPVTRWMVRTGLKEECVFATANHVQQAMDLYVSYAPHIVFLDIQLPDGSGYEVLDWIMWHDPEAYVVMFSSHNDLDNIMKAFESGANGFIAKPFLKDTLLHYIHSHSNPESLLE